jgi:5-methylcytosine-specific restriction protein A
MAWLSGPSSGLRLGLGDRGSGLVSLGAMRSACIEPGCPDFAERRGRCHRHLLDMERASSPRDSLYASKRWRVLRARVLTSAPICAACGEELATQVDHIVPIEDGGPVWKRSNLQGLCGGCHSPEDPGRVGGQGL